MINCHVAKKFHYGINLLNSWVEMMAPVFSRAAWKCVWHMIQVLQLVIKLQISRDIFRLDTFQCAHGYIFSDLIDCWENLPCVLQFW